MATKRTALVSLVGMLLCGAAFAEDCVPREFVQYQAEAKSGSGRISLAFSYCRMQKRRDELVPGSSIGLRCDAELTKIKDSLTAVRARPSIEFARAGCTGDYPSPDVTKR